MQNNNIVISILAEILPHIEAYSNSTQPKLGLDAFNKWMFEKKYEAQSEKIDAKINAMHNKVQSKNDIRINSRIASGVGLLYRFTKLYAKYSFENSVIQSIDEFTYLVSLLYNPTLSKSELIDKMVQEKSTGTEIIKRLLKNKLITEIISKEDKRRKLVSITAIGKKELDQLFPILENISNKVVGDLTNTEKKVLDTMIEKLENYHRKLQKTISK
jgi:DNA-binding MarR family transcriptional regulator